MTAVRSDEMDGETEGIVVRATVNLPGLRAGSYEVVDPNDPYVAELLAATFLVAEPEETP